MSASMYTVSQIQNTSVTSNPISASLPKQDLHGWPRFPIPYQDTTGFPGRKIGVHRINFIVFFLLKLVFPYTLLSDICICIRYWFDFWVIYRRIILVTITLLCVESKNTVFKIFCQHCYLLHHTDMLFLYNTYFWKLILISQFYQCKLRIKYFKKCKMSVILYIKL
jgi:hypothetical protein